MSSYYSATHKQWDHLGSITPEVVHHEETLAINFEAKPAAWLPVVRQETAQEFWITIPAGKVVSVDRDERVVPAGYKHVFEAAAGATVLTYTADDVSARVTDLVTGEVVSSATTYTRSQIDTALQNRGAITSAETARDFISWPVGFAPYNYYAWCGGSGVNPSNYEYHNFNGQHQVAVNADMAIRMPLVPAQEATETQGGGLAIANTAIAFGTAAWKSSTGIAATTEYSEAVSAGDNIVAMVFNKWPVAKITNDTPITDSGGELASMTELDSIAELKTHGSGYFYIDYDRGVLFLYETDGDAIPSGFSAAATITYYTYEDAATGAWTISHATGNLRPGDWVTFDDRSNYVKWTPDIGTAFGGGSGEPYGSDPDYSADADADISAQLEDFVEQARCAVVGQVVGFRDHPRDALNRVKTKFTGFSDYERNAGSATEGRPQSLPLADAANKEVIINFCNR